MGPRVAIAGVEAAYRESSIPPGGPVCLPAKGAIGLSDVRGGAFGMGGLRGSPMEGADFVGDDDLETAFAGTATNVSNAMMHTTKTWDRTLFKVPPR